VCVLRGVHATQHTHHDGPHGPKHVEVTVKKGFNVNFNILYVKQKVHLLVKES
jgi:hypothetical protein